MSGQYGLVIQGDGKGKKDVPLESVSVTGQIKGYVLGLETRLKYRNTSDDPLEVMFRFPVEESTAVVGLEAKIAGRTIKGVVREKEEARQMYDDALSSGLTAALGEDKSGDIFSLALGNLPPKGEAELILKLVGELPLDTESEAVRFSLPTVLKPRYTPAGSSDPLAPIGGEASQVEKSSAPAVSSFALTVAESDDVTSVTSPTHGINTVIKDGSVEVTLTDLGQLDKDMVVLVHYKDPHTPRATVEEGRVEGGNELMSNPAVMLDFFPKFSSLQAACEFVFVVDRSGSMSGTYINSAKDTLILFLKSIPPGCYFNIIGFGSRYEHLFPKSVPYNQTNLDKAMGHAQGLSANLGGTELLSPLEFVFGQVLLPGLPRQIFVLTDGSVSNTQACINVTKKNAHVARVFTFGIGSGASSALVKGLARAGNGVAEFIKEGERMQGKVISSLKKALQPSVTDVELKLSVPPGIEVLQAPSKIPPVFNGEKLVLYGWLKGGAGKSGPGCAVLRGKMLGSPVEHRVDFQLGVSSLSPTDIPVVHQLASKSLIQDWQDGNGLSGKSDKEKKSAIIKLSVESSVVSSHTAYIAVDEDQDKPIEGAIKTWDLTATETHRRSRSRRKARGVGSATITYDLHVTECGDTLTSQYYFLGSRRPPPPPPMMSTSGMHMVWESVGGPPNSFDSLSSVLPPPPPPQPSMMSSFGSPQRRRCPPPPPGGYHDAFSGPPPALSRSDDDLFSFLGGSSSTSRNGTSSLFTVPGGSGSSLSGLVTLQAAEGYWSLDTGLASIFGRSLSDLKGASPSGCSDVVWGTLLAIVLLESRFSSQHDEWELVAMKAEMWLQGQALPAGSSISSLKETAKQSLP